MQVFAKKIKAWLKKVIKNNIKNFIYEITESGVKARTLVSKSSLLKVGNELKYKYENSPKINVVLKCKCSTIKKS